MPWASKGRRCTQDVKSVVLRCKPNEDDIKKAPWDFNYSSLLYNIMKFIVLTALSKRLYRYISALVLIDHGRRHSVKRTKRHSIRLHRLRFACPSRVKTHKLLQVCKQVVTNLFPSCVRTVCSHVVATSLEQAVNNL